MSTVIRTEALLRAVLAWGVSLVRSLFQLEMVATAARGFFAYLGGGGRGKSARTRGAGAGAGASDDPNHVDVIIVGCGISGVTAAVYLKRKHPDKTFLVLEAREEAGGTWSFFKYPGVRCDSPIYTFGFSFRPWVGEKKYPEARQIQRYVHETLEDEGVAERVRYGMRITKAEFHSRGRGPSGRSEWRVETADGSSFSCGFLYLGTGYYKYDAGFTPEFAGLDAFKREKGNVALHAQEWDGSVDYRGKNVAIIGSGASAITILPAMVRAGARQVCMIQRSPTYIAPLPSTKDGWVGILPYSVVRGRHINEVRGFYKACKASPQLSRTMMLKKVKSSLPKPTMAETAADCHAPSRQEVLDAHFTPSYLPWAQRVCIAPDGDFFKAMHKTARLDGDERAEFRRAVVVTGNIDSFTAHGIKMLPGTTASSALAGRSSLIDACGARAGEALEVPCDVAVIATGFNLHENLPASDFRLVVDGVEYDAPQHFVYKSWMLSDVPNLAFCLGYTNNSWTIKSELAAGYLCDVLAYMDEKGFDTIVPRFRADAAAVPKAELADVFPLSAGYVQRSRARLPKATVKAPWCHNHDDRADRKLYARVGDSYDQKFVEFSRSGENNDVGNAMEKTAAATKLPADPHHTRDTPFEAPPESMPLHT